VVGGVVVCRVGCMLGGVVLSEGLSEGWWWLTCRGG